MTQARRQPGSLFKPVAYLAALRKDGPGGAPQFTPVSVVQDEPVTVRPPRDRGRPRTSTSATMGR
jgi:membrane peptidoglycan carboxypeptidase